MSLINLKSKKEHQYFNNIKKEPLNKTFVSNKIEPKYEDKNINSDNSLLIGEGVTITGTVKADNKVTIQGTLDGDLECSNVTVCKSGYIKGELKVETMEVEGKVEGGVNITDLLHIKSKGSVSGKIFYGNIKIDDGGTLIGEIKYYNKDKPQEEFNDWKPL